MNNEIIRNHYDAFDRISGFGKKHGGAFAPESRAAKLFSEIAAVVGKMEENGVKKISGTAGYQGGTNAKQLAAELVREDLRTIRDTAESISEAEGLPEFDDQFRMPRTSSYGVLLSHAKAFLKDAGPHAALFVEFEMPADFLTQLDAHIKLLEKGGDEQTTGLSEQVAGTAELAALTTRGTGLRKQLLTIVRNKFRGEPGILAEWEAAQHIVRPDRGGDVPEPGEPPAA